ERIQSPDFTWAVLAIRIQREVGGNLAELLVTVADTMTARDRLRRDIRSLTAEGRVSAMLLGFLPIAIGLVIYTSNREYMNVLLEETVGQFMLGFTVLLALGGFLWLKKIITIEV
ncbi:MAG: type II secretion system F family protein, partial [Acidimicrobiales bacterium]